MKHFSLTILLFCVVACAACNHEKRYEQYRKEDFARTFDYSIDNVSNFRGKNYSIDLPRGTMFLESYQFEARIPVKIKNETTYKKIGAKKVIDFLENKQLVSAEELQLLRLNKDNMRAWESKKTEPAVASGSGRVIMYITMTTWIVYLPGDVSRYLVVNVQENKNV